VSGGDSGRLRQAAGTGRQGEGGARALRRGEGDGPPPRPGRAVRLLWVRAHLREAEADSLTAYLVYQWAEAIDWPDPRYQAFLAACGASRATGQPEGRAGHDRARPPGGAEADGQQAAGPQGGRAHAAGAAAARGRAGRGAANVAPGAAMADRPIKAEKAREAGRRPDGHPDPQAGAPRRDPVGFPGGWR
jgi:hypothetical protein